MSNPTQAKKPERPRVERTESIAEAAGKVLRFHFQRMMDNEEGTRAGENIEALHDMRVSTRRLRAALRVFRKPIGRELLKPHSAELKWLASVLGQVRDLDVWLEHLSAYAETTSPELREDTRVYIDTEKAEREARRQPMIAELDSDRFARLKENFRKLLDSDLPAYGADEAVGPFAAKSIRKRMKKVLAYDDNLKSASEKDLHQLRIAGKWLRYTGEFFAGCFGARIKEMMQMMREIQDALGELHDTVVWRERIGETKSEVLVRLKQRLAEEADEHRGEFFRVWSRLTAKHFQKALRKELKEPSRNRADRLGKPGRPGNTNGGL